MQFSAITHAQFISYPWMTSVTAAWPCKLATERRRCQMLRLIFASMLNSSRDFMSLPKTLELYARRTLSATAEEKLTSLDCAANVLVQPSLMDLAASSRGLLQAMSRAFVCQPRCHRRHPLFIRVLHNPPLISQECCRTIRRRWSTNFAELSHFLTCAMTVPRASFSIW